MTIQHIVLSGGGPTGFITYGVLKHLQREKYWDLNNIKTIYGTSIGAFVGILISLKYKWKTLDNYLIKRPWDKIISIEPEELFSAFNRKGILNINLIQQALEPLLLGKQLSATITLEEFYQYNHIEIHMYSININDSEFKKVDLSYKTHPNMTLVDALTATTAFPILIPPLCLHGNCYVDGGLLNNLPINDCLNQTKCKKESILAIRNKKTQTSFQMDAIQDDSTMIQYVFSLLGKIIYYIGTDKDQASVPNEVLCLLDSQGDYKRWLSQVVKQKIRRKLIKQGIKDAKLFLYYQNLHNR